MKIKNIDLGKVISFLERQNFKGLQSVNRTKVTNYLTKRLQEIIEGEKTIREDGKDKPRQWLEKELQEYFNQTVTVEGANFEPGLVAIKNKIEELTNEESEHEFSNEDAHALFVLYEALGIGDENDGNNN